MTSAPSHRLRLSGNNATSTWLSAGLVALLICLLVSSCGVSRKTPSRPTTTEPPKKEIEVPTANEPPAPAKPEIIKISYLLPFKSSDLVYDSIGNIAKKLPEETRIALDYYRGALMALDTIQKGGVRMKAMVFDTREDSSRIKLLFDKTEVQQSHLIIGPVFNPQLESAAPLARKYKVPMLSPFSTANNFIDHNPYYILANSTLNTHCELLYDYIIEQHHPQRVLLLHNSTANERQYAENFIHRETRMKNGVQLTSLTDSTELTYERVEEMLDDSGANIIIIPSTNETFVSNMVRKLAGLADKYSIYVYGMPQWRDAKSLREDYLDKVNCRITAAIWFDKNDPAIKKFSDAYALRYGSSASEYALEGYNQTLFFASFIAAKGNNFEKNLPDYTMTTAGESFRFQTMRRNSQANKNESTTIPPFDFIENRSVHILEYKAGKLVLIK